MPCADTRSRGAALNCRLAVKGIHWDSMSLRGGASFMSVTSGAANKRCAKVLDRPDGFADGPQRQAGQLEMGPGERDADDGHRQQDRQDQVAEREPPSGENEPDQVAEESERAGAEVVAAVIVGARHRALAEWQQRV